MPLGGLAPEEALRLAASVDQMSAHALAESLVLGAALVGSSSRCRPRSRSSRDMASPARSRATGSPWARAGGSRRGYAGASRHAADGTVDGEAGRARILVGVDGRLEALIVMGDRLRQVPTPCRGRSTRPASRTSLSSAGTEGDRGGGGAGGRHRTGVLGTDAGGEARGRAGGSRPAEPAKRRHGRRRHQRCAGTRLADVGIAMAGKETISSETADVVITVDDVQPDRAVGADRPPLAPHRTRERRRRPRPVRRGDGRGGPRLPASRLGRALPGGDRRHRHPQRPAGAARPSYFDVDSCT